MVSNARFETMKETIKDMFTENRRHFHTMLEMEREYATDLYERANKNARDLIKVQDIVIRHLMERLNALEKEVDDLKKQQS